MNRNIPITLIFATCIPAALPCTHAKQNLPDILTATKQYCDAHERYINSSINEKQYRAGDAILESRGCCIAYSRDAGDAPVLYRSSLLEENNEVSLLAVNGDFVLTLSPQGKLKSVDVWDSRTLFSIASVLLTETSYSDFNNAVYWYGYSTKTRQLSFCYECFYRTRLDGDTRFALNLNDFKSDSIRVSLDGLSQEKLYIEEGYRYPNITSDAFVQLGHTGIPAPNTPALVDGWLTGIGCTPLMKDYAVDFWTTKNAFNWEQIDPHTLTFKHSGNCVVNTSAPGNISVNQAYKVEWDSDSNGYYAYPSYAKDLSSLQHYQYNEKPKPQSIYFYSCKNGIWIPVYQIPAGVGVSRMHVGESDMGFHTIVDYRYRGGHGGGLESEHFIYNSVDKKVSCICNEKVPAEKIIGDDEYPPEMLGPVFRVYPIASTSDDVRSKGMGGRLSVWNRLQGTANQAYWIAASEGVCSLYRVDEKTHIVQEMQRFDLGADVRPYWDNKHKLLYLPNTPHSWRVYKVDDTIPRADFVCYAYDKGTRDFAYVLPNGHYAGSPGCESFLISAIEEGAQVGMQALAPWRNRPAEVLEALGAPSEEVEVLQQTTRRWLTKQKYNPDAMPNEPAFKDFARVEVDMPRLLTTDAETSFGVKLCPGAHDIARLIVRADGVEIPQTAEASTSGRVAKSVSVKVPLATRENWIEVTPVDSNGISGDTCRFRVIRQGQAKPDLYIVSLGVSKYNDESLNLQYAAKDATDIAGAFEKYGAGEKKHVLLLTDEQVQDKSCLERVKGFLSAATSEDRVVFYCAGHGLLDENLDYYFAPAGIDVENVAATGISMKELQSALRETPARERLLLLDTCHAGSVGEEDEDRLVMAGALPHGVRAILHRGMKVKKAVAALNAEQKKRYIEEMFSMGEGLRGVNVIAGSAGAEYAQESEEWNNGVFTSAVMECLKYWYRADANQDCNLSVAELGQYVSSRVGRLTGDAQKPKTSALENTGRMVLLQGGQLSLAQCIDLLSWVNPTDVTEAKSKHMLETMLKQCAAGGDVNMKSSDGSGNTPLHYAAKLGSFHISRTLVAAGASNEIRNSSCESPEFCAKGVAKSLLIDRGYYGRLDRQVQNWQMEGYLPEGQAIANTAALDDTSVQKGGTSPQAAQASAQDVINHLNAMGSGKGAAKVFRSKLLQIMPRIQNGADVSSPLPKETNTPLHYACGLNDVMTVKWLLDHGANTAARNKQGQTPADCARLNSAWAALSALEQGGASSSSYQPGYTPSAPAQSGTSVQDVINHLNAMGAGKGAAKVFRSKLLQIMPRIQNGASVNSPLPKETNTPLHYACGLNDVMTVQWLLDHGADAAARNKQGQTPADCARLNNSGAALNVLQQRGVAY